MVQTIEPGHVLLNLTAPSTPSNQLVTTAESKHAPLQTSSEADLARSAFQRSLISRFARSFHRRLEPPHAHPSKSEASPYESAANDTSLLDRDLQGRHMQMIAIGGAIGTGLFVGSGSALATGGPAALMIGFGLIGVMLFCVVHALGELAVMFPIAGNSAQVDVDVRVIFDLLDSVY